VGAIGVTAAAILGVTVLLLLLLDPMPPRAIGMATGPKDGAYYEISKHYQLVLERAGVRLALIETEGSLENLALLRDLALACKSH